MIILVYADFLPAITCRVAATVVLTEFNSMLQAKEARKSLRDMRPINHVLAAGRRSEYRKLLFWQSWTITMLLNTSPANS